MGSQCGSVLQWIDGIAFPRRPVRRPGGVGLDEALGLDGRGGHPTTRRMAAPAVETNQFPQSQRPSRSRTDPLEKLYCQRLLRPVIRSK
jgi:hypothetical protein